MKDIFLGAFDQIGAIITGAFYVVKGIVKVFTGLLTGNFQKFGKEFKLIIGGACNAVVDLFLAGFKTINNLVAKGLPTVGMDAFSKNVSQVNHTMEGFADGFKFNLKETETANQSAALVAEQSASKIT